MITRFLGRTSFVATLFGVAAVFVGAFRSSTPSLWGDEIATLLTAERTIPSMFQHVFGVFDTVHAVYYITIHFWMGAFGTTPFAIRFFSAIAIGVAVAGAVVLAKLLADRKAAWFVGAVALFLPRLTESAIEAKSTALSVALVTWLSVLLVWLLRRQERRIWPWMGYGLLVTLSLSVFMFTGLMLIAHLVVVLTARVHRDVVLRWVAAATIGALQASTIIIIGFFQRSQVSWIESNQVTWPKIFIEPWFVEKNYAVAVSAVLLLAGGYLLLRKLSSMGESTEPSTDVDDSTPVANNPALNPFTVGLSLAIVPIATLLLATQFIDMYVPRYVAMSSTAVAFILGNLLSRTPLALGLAGAVLLAGAAVPDYLHQRTVFAKHNDFSSVAKYIGSNSMVGDAIVFDEASTVWSAMRTMKYAYPNEFKKVNDVTFLESYQEKSWLRDRFYSVPEVADKFSTIQRVWLVEYRKPGSEPNDYALADLTTLGFKIAVKAPNRFSMTYLLTR